MAETGYCNGSDMLLYIGEKAIGHCTSHTTTVSTETKDRAVKPLANAPATQSLWKNKGIVGLSVSISAEGLCFYNETENGYAECLALISAGNSVQVKCMVRGSENPYLSGNFVVTSLERSDPAQDDATYSINLENDGPVTLDNSKITAPSTSQG